MLKNREGYFTDSIAPGNAISKINKLICTIKIKMSSFKCNSYVKFFFLLLTFIFCILSNFYNGMNKDKHGKIDVSHPASRSQTRGTN